MHIFIRQEDVLYTYCITLLTEEIIMLEKIQSMLAEALDLPLEKVTPDAKIVDDLGADSLDRVELVMALEDEFDLEIMDSESEKFVTVADVVAFIESKKG